ncbi:hypothetical protein JS278_01707 [Acidipropionibacterium virtanenii]|uniref:Uncharacterized protein n=1 Tax=Acidipropionibacterium virtanenii TaxID=2057246 RepID=A0A344UUC2_9ACTN|nr:hypothetical protein JS278_01707 [Acidipropionibacterium virtanenii]
MLPRTHRTTPKPGNNGRDFGACYYGFVNGSESRVLSVLPDLLAGESRMSEATRRQREWAVMGALEFLAGSSTMRAMARISVADLMDPDAVDAYVRASQSGTLRVRRPTGKASESPRSTAARVSALRWLARATGTRQPPPFADWTPLAPIPDDAPAALRTACQALTTMNNFYATRTAATIAVLYATGASGYGLCTLRTEQIVSEHGRRLIRMPAQDPAPHRWEPGDDTALAPVPAWGTAALDDWLVLRAGTVACLQGSDPRTLLVSGRANAGPRPPGMPLQPRGLGRSWARSRYVAETAVPGLAMPFTLEAACRAVRALVLTPEPPLPASRSSAAQPAAVPA